MLPMQVGKKVLSIAAGFVLLSAPLARPVSAAETRVIATGLDNPRGLDFSLLGALYVAEAGRGGAGPCVAGPGAQGQQECFGSTGAVTRIWHGKQERVASGLPSLAAASGMNATGPHDIAAFVPGLTYITIGLGGGLSKRATVGERGSLLGHVVRLSHSARPSSVADLAAFEDRENPDGLSEGPTPDSNPYGLFSLTGHLVAIDAAGNTLLSVGHSGRVSPLAVFPTRTVPGPPFPGSPATVEMQPVPTTVTRGPDGAYYVGELTGFPFPKGEARVYRVVPGQAPTIYASGFTAIIDIAFGRDGSLYVLEFAKNGVLAAELQGDRGGRLVKVSRGGQQTTVLTEPLIAPGGVAVGHDGALYVTNYSIFASTSATPGQVLRIKP
jgi:hypothetical protein